MFGKSLISSDFLERIITSKFRDMGNLCICLLSLVTAKRSDMNYGKTVRPMMFSETIEKNP